MGLGAISGGGLSAMDASGDVGGAATGGAGAVELGTACKGGGAAGAMLGGAAPGGARSDSTNGAMLGGDPAGAAGSADGAMSGGTAAGGGGSTNGAMLRGAAADGAGSADSAMLGGAAAGGAGSGDGAMSGGTAASGAGSSEAAMRDRTGGVVQVVSWAGAVLAADGLGAVAAAPTEATFDLVTFAALAGRSPGWLAEVGRSLLTWGAELLDALVPGADCGLARHPDGDDGQSRPSDGARFGAPTARISVGVVMPPRVPRPENMEGFLLRLRGNSGRKSRVFAKSKAAVD